MSTTRLATRAATYGAVAAGSALVGAGSAWMGAATYFARKVLTPDPHRPDDAHLHVIHTDSVTLSATEDLVVPGRYGLWLDGGAGHARVGEVLEIDKRHDRVRRRLLGVDAGVLRPGPVRVNGYFYAQDPFTDLGLATEDVVVPGRLGPLPSWVVPPEGGIGTRWAVLVHGRGARRIEAIRALPALHRAGLTSLVPSYRNDGEAPPGPDGRYTLGLSEWEDIEDAMSFALARGAEEIVLVGWSMGGAIVLQTLDRSPLADKVSSVILDGPVVDWADVLGHQADLHSLPRALSDLSIQIMGSALARGLIGVAQPVDVTKTDWVRRADELTHPMLLIHSRDDEFVPSGPSEALANARPDLITFEPWSLARHCREWNTDPKRWERVVADYLA